MELEERLDFIEFRQELLFEDSSYSRLLFEYKVTRDQSKQINELFSEYRDKIDAGEEVHHGSYEQRIYEICPSRRGDYHFAEFLAQTNHELGYWEEVFEKLYGDMTKFQSYMKNRS